MRQRQPPQRNPRYLQWLRAQGCACGCRLGPPSDAAHIRASSAKYDKPMTGMGARPDDRWALPLRHRHHMAQHEWGDELGWWSAHGIADPFALCLKYYRRYTKEQVK